MFSMQNFVMDTLSRMIDQGEVDYRVMQYASTWYWRGTLNDENMTTIETQLKVRDQSQIDPEFSVDPEELTI